MVNAPAGSMQHTDGGTRWVTAIASLMVGTAFFALWFWLLPSWLGFQTAGASALGWRWIAAVFSVLGFSVALRMRVGLWIVLPENPVQPMAESYQHRIEGSTSLRLA